MSYNDLEIGIIFAIIKGVMNINWSKKQPEIKEVLNA